MEDFDVNTIASDKLCLYIQKRICRADSLPEWSSLLSDFADNTNAHKKRYKMVQTALLKLKESNVTTSHETEIIQRLGKELSKFRSKHLVLLVNFCLDTIQSFEISNGFSWKELLPELLNVLASRDKVEYNETEINGTEYKKQIINTICSIKWPPNLLISLAAMFKETPLTKEEHFQIVTKLCQSMESLTPQEVPAFTYQLLRLCKHQHGKSIILRLNTYFGKRLYKNVHNTNHSSEETIPDSMDLIESHSNFDTMQAESTVLYHIYEAATLGNGTIKEYLNSLKVISKTPEYILHPFQLVVLLAISSVQCYEETVLELIKYSLSKSITEDQKRGDSAWFNEMVPLKINIDSIFHTILDSNLKEKGIVVQGLINLSFCLLTSSPLLGRDAIAEIHWNLSYLILTKLVKKRNDVAPTILKLLQDKIVTEHPIQQYTECLYQICRAAPILALENQSIIVQLIEQMVQLTSTSSILVVRSVLPLMKISYNIRDSLILVLRKALYSRDTGTRQMAVIGFLQLIGNFKVCNLVALSQSECSSAGSGRSILSQISIEHRASETINRSVHSNEVLCLEVLNVLRRCFMLQAEVKTQLYDGLYHAICTNPELQTHGLDMLYSHFKKFYSEDEEPPILLNGIIVVKETEAVLQEPLGKYLFILGSIVAKLKDDDAINLPTLAVLKEVLANLVEKMGTCDLNHFDMDNGATLQDNLAEGQAKQLKLKQILLIYESLMGYIVLTWDKKTDCSAQLLQLFKVYSKFLDLAKSIGKKKESAKRKKDDSVKKSEPAKPFKFGDHVINLEVIEKMLSLLYLDSIEWATKAQSNMLRTCHEFHSFAVVSLIELLPTITASKIECDHASHYLRNCINIGFVLYQKCIKRLSDVADFDRQVAATTLEAFYGVLKIICTHYKKKLPQFLSEIQELESNETTLSEQIFPVLEVLEHTFESADLEADEKLGIKNSGLLILKIITLLTTHLPTSSVYASQVLDWLKKFGDNDTKINKLTFTSLLNLLFALQLRCKSTIHARGNHPNTGFFNNVALQICKITGSIDHEGIECQMEIKTITEDSVMIALQSLCKTLQSQLDNVDWIIGRLRADHAMIKFPAQDSLETKREKLKTNEFDLCFRVSHLIEIAVTISNIAVPPGNLTEMILKLLTHLYNILGSLTKYFIMRSSKDLPVFQNARFEKVVQIAEKLLSTNVYLLILFIEENQNQADNEEIPSSTTSQPKKRKVDSANLKSKVLRDTRFIPKLVYSIELFGKLVIQLGNKTKTDLKKYMKQGASRDFRIKAPALKTALETLGLEETYIDEDETNDEVNNSDAGSNTSSQTENTVVDIDTE